MNGILFTTIVVLCIVNFRAVHSAIRWHVIIRHFPATFHTFSQSVYDAVTPDSDLQIYFNSQRKAHCFLLVGAFLQINIQVSRGQVCSFFWVGLVLLVRYLFPVGYALDRGRGSCWERVIAAILLAWASCLRISWYYFVNSFLASLAIVIYKAFLNRRARSTTYGISISPR